MLYYKYNSPTNLLGLQHPRYILLLSEYSCSKTDQIHPLPSPLCIPLPQRSEMSLHAQTNGIILSKCFILVSLSSAEFLMFLCFNSLFVLIVSLGTYGGEAEDLF